MTRYERAAQIWAVLAWAAKCRQTLTYVQLSRLTGAHIAGLGAQLEPIQSHCLVKELPPLTALVVGQETGLPGSGFTGATAAELGRAQSSVYDHDWLAEGNPGPDQLERAATARPSNGI